MLSRGSRQQTIIEKQIIYTVAFSIAAVLIFIVLTTQASLHSFKITAPASMKENITLPLHRSGKGPTEYIFEGVLERGFLSTTKYRIIPDNYLKALKVNNQDVDLSSITNKARSDIRRGFEIDLHKYVTTGDNTLSITLKDFGGDLALSITPITTPNHTFIALSILLVLMLVYQFVFLGSNKTRTFIVYSLLVFFNALQVYIIFRFNPVDHIGSDAARHWAQGSESLRMDLMSMTDPILYQIYIGIIAKLSLKTPILVWYFTSILALVTPWVWYRFMRELQPSKTLALYGWVIISALPSWMSIYSYFMQETLMLALLGGSLWATWRARRLCSLQAFLVMVLLWILAGLTRGICIPLAAVCCTWLWLEQSNKISKALYSTAVLILIMGPLTYRSHYQANLFAPHGMGHLANIYGKSGKKEIFLHTERNGGKWTHGFGSPSMGALPFTPLSDWKTQREGKVVVTVDLMKGNEDWGKAREKIEMTFEKRLWILKEDLIFLFFAPSWPDNNPSRLVDQVNIQMRWIWAPLFLLFVGLTIYYRKELKRKWLLPSILVTWFIVQGLLSISVNEGRYRKPLEGLLIAQFILFSHLYSARKRNNLASATNENHP